MPRDLALALDPIEALIVLHERADAYDCDVAIERPSPFDYAVKVTRRDRRRTPVAAVRLGDAGRAVRQVLAVMP